MVIVEKIKYGTVNKLGFHQPTSHYLSSHADAIRIENVSFIYLEKLICIPTYAAFFLFNLILGLCRYLFHGSLKPR